MYLNVIPWLTCLISLALALVLVGGRKAAPAILFFIGMTWLQIATDVANADLVGISLNSGPAGPFRLLAIQYSLAALLFLALGIRGGVVLGISIFGREGDLDLPVRPPLRQEINLHRAMYLYLFSLVISQIGSFLAHVVPAVAQPLLALGVLRYASIFLVAATVFQNRTGYIWLTLIFAFEVTSGMIGYFSNYKEVVYIILMAMIYSRVKPNMPQLIFGAAITSVMLWVSLVWSAVKAEYRTVVFDLSTGQRLSWMLEKYTGDSIDYREAATALLARIGYTDLFAQVVQQIGGRALNKSHFYLDAIVHSLTPRILFPHKSTLNDSIITSNLLNMSIAENTSIGIGYVAQAFVDFGFPGLLVPICSIGVMLGVSTQYLMTRAAPRIIRAAICTATVFLAFPFAANIDKALGGFLVSMLAMSVVLNLGYPRIAGWLAGLQRMAPNRGRTGLPRRAPR